MKVVNGKLFWILLALGIIGTITVWPLIVLLHGGLFQMLSISAPLLFGKYLLSSAIFLAGIIFIGLALGKQVGLGVFIERRRLFSILLFAILIGFLAGFSILVVDSALSILRSGSVIPDIFGEQVSEVVSFPPKESTGHVFLTPWQGFLVALYGGLVEEIFVRFFLMTLLVWGLWKVTKKTQPSSLIMWVAIVVVAFVTGLVHVPVMASFSALSFSLLFRIWLLSIIPAILFGWLYWKRGLGIAMAAHFSTDIFVFVLFPLLA